MPTPTGPTPVTGAERTDTPPPPAPHTLDGHVLLSRLDTPPGDIGWWTATGPDGAPCVLMAADGPRAEDAGYRLRFWSEAGNSRRLNSRWAAPVKDVSPARAAVPWVSYGCFPALTLSAALAAHDGPLPEHTVVVLGRALAEALFTAHSHGLVHAGLSPHSVLLTDDGPRLTGYGLVRAAAPEGSARPRVPGVPADSVPPEQAAGARPVPAGDIYALGSVLAHAAGLPHRPPQPPGGLAEVVSRCLAADPAHRPRAEEVLRGLRPAGPHDVALPEPVRAALAAQRAQAPAAPLPPPPPGPPPGTAPARRTLLLAAGAGVAGLAVGTAAVATWRTVSPPRRASVPRTVPGAAPAPLWRRKTPGDGLQALTLVGERTLVMAAGAGAGTFALDVRSGRQLWRRDDVLTGQLLPAARGRVVATSSGDQGVFSLLSARDGAVKWHERKYLSTGPDQPLTMALVAGHQAGVLFLVAEDVSASSEKPDTFLLAYRVRDRKELWRRRLPSGLIETLEPPQEGVAGPAVVGSTLLLANAGLLATGDHLVYRAIDVRDGREKWKRTYDGIPRRAAGLLLPLPGGLLVAAVDDALLGVNLADGAERWRVPVSGTVATGAARRGHLLYAADSALTTYAVDLRDGSVRWRRKDNGAADEDSSVSAMTLSASGRTLFRSSSTEIDAFDTRDGSPRWRLATVGEGELAANGGVVPVSAPGVAVVVNDSGGIYGLPVD